MTINKDLYSKLLVELQPQAIESEEEFNRALAIIERFMVVEGNTFKSRTPEEDAIFKVFLVLVQSYEEQTYHSEESSPRDMLLHLMESNGYRQADLIGVLGSRGAISEIINGKRSISKKKAKALAQFFSVSVDHFL